jgi:serine protease Do
MSTHALNIETIENAYVQIATPQCIGIGFVLPSIELIITNFNIVEGNQQVIVYSNNQKRFLADVLYIDEVYDIAFLEKPKGFEVKSLLFNTDYATNDSVFIKTKKLKTGEIIKATDIFHHIKYIPTNIPIDTAFSGSPLINNKGEIIGINTSSIYENDETGYALPIIHVLKSIQEYHKTNKRIATRCTGCKLISTLDSKFDHCNGCDANKLFSTDYPKYEAEGVSRTIEGLIEKIGHEAPLSRRGPNHWALIEGSATIYLSYYEPRGYILGDAFLCSLPENSKITEKIYQFLLQQNYLIKGLTFSINENDIVLSLIIYDRHLNTDTAIELLQTLLEGADYYDNVLVEQYGAVWKN